MGISQTDSTHKIRKRNFTCFSKKKKKNLLLFHVVCTKKLLDSIVYTRNMLPIPNPKRLIVAMTLYFVFP